MEGYKALDNSEFNLYPYKALKRLLFKWYSLVTDGIQKFTKQLNGVMIRTLDENYKIINMLCALSVITGGSMDLNKLCTQLLAQIISLKKFGVIADEEFMKNLGCMTVIRFTHKMQLTFKSKKLILLFKTDHLPWLEMVVALIKKLKKKH